MASERKQVHIKLSCSGCRLNFATQLLELTQKHSQCNVDPTWQIHLESYQSGMLLKSLTVAEAASPNIPATQENSSKPDMGDDPASALSN